MFTKNQRRSGRRATLGPECLEGRQLMAVSVSLAGDALRITGNNASDVVTISDNGTDEPGNIRVEGTGLNSPFVSPIAIRTVTVDLGGGNDRLTYNLGGTLVSGGLQAGVTREVNVNGGPGRDVVSIKLGAGLDPSPETLFDGFASLHRDARFDLNVDLGSGNDTFVQEVADDIRQGATLRTIVNGGAGMDMITVDASRSVTLFDRALFDLELRGGAGMIRDIIGVNYRGELDGQLDLMVDGGAGNDVLSVDILAENGSEGNVGRNGRPIRVLGGAGNDIIRLAVRDLNAPSFFNPVPRNITSVALIDGGAGMDMADFTPSTVGEVRGVELRRNI